MASRKHVSFSPRLHRFVAGLAVGSLGLLTGGCTYFGIKDVDVLSEALPQSYQLRYPVERVWAALRAESESGGRSRVLAVDEATRTLSWISSVDRSMGRHESLMDLRVGRRGRSVPAITVVRVEAIDVGSRIFVRQTYFPTRSRFGIAPSRGTYEKTLIQTLEQRLRGEGRLAR